MKLPTIRGLIERRVLINFRVDPAVMQRALPPTFRPRIINGHAMAGICLIRLRHIRPALVPAALGVSSENAAHRVAVQWGPASNPQLGVYVARRDTSSALNALAGGRLFPGIHHHAKFNVLEENDSYQIALNSDDGQTALALSAKIADQLPPTSVFPSLAAASSFFEDGAVGYSPSHQPGNFQGMELRCKSWNVQPLHVTSVKSSYFDDPTLFPPSSVTFDCALLMRNIEHEWITQQDICCPTAAAV